MSYICPKCKRIAEYNTYYGRVICTSCDWQSEKFPKNISKECTHNESILDRRNDVMCNHKDGSISSILGIPVDPCVYKDVESYKNVTVIVSRCINCGNIDIRWKKQDNTEEIEILDE